MLEEISLEIDKSEIDFFGTFNAIAAGSEAKTLRMDVYMVKHWTGEPTPTSGAEVIDDIQWIN